MHYACLWPKQPDHTKYELLQLDTKRFEIGDREYDEEVDFLVYCCSTCSSQTSKREQKCSVCFKELGSALTRSVQVEESPNRYITVHDVCAAQTCVFKLKSIEGYQYVIPKQNILKLGDKAVVLPKGLRRIDEQNK